MSEALKFNLENSTGLPERDSYSLNDSHSMTIRTMFGNFGRYIGKKVIGISWQPPNPKNFGALCSNDNFCATRWLNGPCLNPESKVKCIFNVSDFQASFLNK